MSVDHPSTTDAGIAQGAAPTTAGGLLRQARLARGLHIAALANSIKVTPQKLEMLETNRLDQLPGHAFARALAQTVCRFLKIDAAPVMALLPPPPGHGLDRMTRGLNEPFRDSPGRRVPTELQITKNPVLLGAAGILLAAVVIFMMPRQWFIDHLPHLGSSHEAPAKTIGTVTQPVSTSETIVPTGAAVLCESTGPGASAPSAVIAPVPSPSDAASAFSSTAEIVTVPPQVLSPTQAQAPDAVASAPAPVPAGLQLKATAASWVDVKDKRGVSLMSRRMQPGESVSLDGASPLRVKIRNASAVQLSFNGQPVDLTPVTSRGNIARIELR